MRVVVVGAGVAGSIAARFLDGLPGVELLCLERVRASEHSESGTGLNLGPNAVKALRLYAPDLHRAILALSYAWTSWRVSLTDGTPISDLPLSAVADDVGIRIRWSDLYAELRRGIAGVIRFGTPATGAGYEGRGRDRLFVDGPEGRIEGVDLLVCGDGRYSTLREHLIGPPRIRHHGVIIGRLLVPDTSGGLIDDYEQWFHGANRLLAFRVPTDSVYIAATFPVPAGSPIPASVRDERFVRSLYEPTDAQPSPPCRWLVEQLCGDLPAVHWARFQDVPPCYLDTHGHALFLGDAAHSMVPTLGQGATQAVEDGCVMGTALRRHLIEHGPDPRSLPNLLASIERLRTERLRFVMDFSVEATDIIEGRCPPVEGSLTKLEAPFLAKLRRLYRDVPVI